MPVAAVSVACVTFMPDLHHGFRCGGASRLSESGVGSWNGKSKSGANMDIYFLLCIISVLLFSIPNTLFSGLFVTWILSNIWIKSENRTNK